MPIDPNILLGAKGIDLPNPLALAQQGLTIGNLANQNALTGLAVQQQQQMQNLYSDPQYLEGFSKMLGLAGGGDSDALMQALQQNPLAAASAIGGLLKMQGEAATRDDLIAKAEKTRFDTKNAALDNLSSSAAAFFTNPSDAGLKSVINQMAFMQKAHHISPQDYGVNVDDLISGDPQRLFNATQQLALLRTPTKDQASIVNMTVDNWSKIAETKLKFLEQNKPVLGEDVSGNQIRTTPYAQGTAPQMPAPPNVPQVPGAPVMPQVGGQPAPNYNGAVGSGNTPANTPNDRIAILQGELQKLPDDDPNRQLLQREINRLAGGGGQPTGTKMKLSAEEEGDLKNTLKEAENANAAGIAAPQTKSLVIDMRNKDLSGMIAGPVAGREWFQTMMQVLSPLMSPEDQAKIAQTNSWQADTGVLIANAVKQFVGAGGRVAARELDFFKDIKPNLLMTQEGRMAVYENIYSMADKLAQNQAQLQAYRDAQRAKGNYSLGGFVPQLTETKMPPMKVDSLPDPRTWNTKVGFVDDNGHLHRVINGRWQDMGAQQSMVDQIPR
jgi:hypothetical protein